MPNGRLVVAFSVSCLLLGTPAFATAGSDAAPESRPRASQISVATGFFSRSEVEAHLSTHTEPALSFHLDMTVPVGWFEVGGYLRDVVLRSSETGGTLAAFTVGAVVKYELPLGPRVRLRAGPLVGIDVLYTDTMNSAIGLDLGGTLESAIRVSRHLRVRLGIQGATMVLGGLPDHLGVRSRFTAISTLGLEYAFTL